MNKKNNNQDNLIVSEFLVEAKELEIRYKSIKKTVKNLKKFTEAQIKGQVAEA